MKRIDGLRYIKNTNGGATPQNFWEDWDPVGVLEWNSLIQGGLVQIDNNGRIWLTPRGEERLAEMEIAK